MSAESVELMKNLLFFFNASASQLPLKAIHQPGKNHFKIIQAMHISFCGQKN